LVVDSVQNGSGGGTTIFLNSTGDVYFAGTTANGIFLNGSNSGVHATPVQQTGLSNIVKVGTCGGFDAYALDASGNLYGWGSNAQGELGLGDTTSRSSPTLLHTSVHDFAVGTTDIGGTNGWAVALLQDGSLIGTGYNGGGVLGQGNTTNHNGWIALTYPSGTIVALGTGLADEGTFPNGRLGYTLLTMADGSSYGAGNTPDGQLGLSTTLQSSWVSLPFVNSQRVFGSAFATFSWKSDNTLWSIGYNGFLLLGNTGIALNGHTNSPVQVQLPVGLTAVQSGEDGQQIAAKTLGSDGNVYVWGANAQGEGGNGTATGNIGTPTAVSSFPSLGSPVWVGGTGTNVFAGTIASQPLPPLSTSIPSRLATIVG